MFTYKSSQGKQSQRIAALILTIRDQKAGTPRANWIVPASWLSREIKQRI